MCCGGRRCLATVREVELSSDTVATYVRHAFTQMLAVADRLGEEAVNRRPAGPGTNAVAALVVHCCELTEFWLGHVALGHESQRDRESEFSRHATLAELHAAVDEAVAGAEAALRRLDAGEGTTQPVRQFLLDGDTSDASVVLHVLEELYQHLGHIELTADVLAPGGG
jgi:uncharacterized damage-inducible protein DinB